MPFHRPESLESALAVLRDGAVCVLAGGTDVYPSLRDAPPPTHIMDLSRISLLRGIRREAESWRIGATTTWTDIVDADLPPLFDGLKDAAREVGSIQIQNAGTLAGNICNASPAADGVPPLLTLDAQVEIAGASRVRRIPLCDFITGVRQTSLEPDEIVTAIIVPHVPEACSSFLKLGARRYLVISIAMVAAVVVPSANGGIAEARIAVGACSAVAKRLPELEARLQGWRTGATSLDDMMDAADLSALTPLDDIRGTAQYRREAVREMLRRALVAAMPGNC